MERLGQDRGLIHYRTRVPGPRPELPLRIDGLADRAQVFADGRPLGVLERNSPGATLPLATGPDGVVLDILVEALGRVNYGPQMDDRKGITRGVSHGHQRLFDWQIRPLPLTDLSALRFTDDVEARDGELGDGEPAFHRFTAELPSPPTRSSPCPTGAADCCGSTASCSAATAPPAPSAPSTPPPRCGGPAPTNWSSWNSNATARHWSCATDRTSARSRRHPAPSTDRPGTPPASGGKADVFRSRTPGNRPGRTVPLSAPAMYPGTEPDRPGADPDNRAVGDPSLPSIPVSLSGT